MGPYIFLIIMTLLLGYLHSKSFISKKRMCVLISVVAVLIFGLRDMSVGNVDVPRFVNSYQRLAGMSFQQIFLSFQKDVFFYLLAKPISMAFPDYHIWFFVIGILFFSSVSTLIYSESEDVCLSYIVFFTFFYTLNFSLLRHCCALSFCIFSYTALKKNKKVISIILAVIAFGFHLTAVSFLLIFFLNRVRFGTKFIAGITGFFLMGRMVPDLLNRIVSFLSVDRFNLYGVEDRVKTLTYSAFFIFLILFSICLFFLFASNELKRYNQLDLNMAAVSLCFYALVIVLAEFYRMAMFFSFVIIVLLPNAIGLYEIKMKMHSITSVQSTSNYRMFFFVKAGIYILLIMRLFFTVLPGSGLVPYVYFWNA